ncbi:hypothetical protein AYK24_10800 [Thermoplasmatales archaeon SG8-52-4]|nr:MAG: hypothetical protein AYK24_10800 [Thermoplasmatales archaeon SG8-52-4]
MRKFAIIGIILIFLFTDVFIFTANSADINIVRFNETPDIEAQKIDDFLTIYDFNGITSPSTDHKACFKQKIKDLNDRPPKTGPVIDDLIEFTTSDYIKIYSNDNDRADTYSSLGKQLHYFQFNILENILDIKGLHVRWYGHASNTHVNLYIWNFNDNLWEKVGVNRFTHRDAAISKTYINNINEYIDETKGQLHLVAITRAATLLKQHLFTNYVQVKVGNPSTVTLKDDAYHYNNEKTYAEWWFFQVIDKSQDIQFYISYHITKTIDTYLTAGIGVFEGSKIYEIREYHPESEFYASYDKPDVKMGDCYLIAQDENTFLINGDLNDGKNSAIWDLTFKRTAPPYDFIESSGETEYLAYLPGSFVNGTIKLNGIEYFLNNSYGYHDHNWGGGPYLPCQWAWAAVCKPEDNFALAMEKVEHFTWYTREIYVTLNDLTICFDDVQTRFEDFKFKFQLSFPFFTYYPRVRRIYAKNDEGYVIDLEAVVQKNIPVLMGSPRILNEQVSLFKGAFEKNEQIIYSIDVLGFTDYSTF